jgi:hypothetical protein
MRLAAALFVSVTAFGEPRLLLNRVDVDRIQKLAQSERWAADVVHKLIEFADDWPASHVREFGLAEWALPREGAGWSHNYVCPEHGVRLTQKQGKNLCPIDGKDYHGWPVDYVVYMQRNDDNARAARDLGLAYSLTGKAEYAEKARRIFTAYCELYPTLPVHDNNNRLDTKTGARVMSQTLSEAKWLVPLTFGYDLVRDTMPDAERARFESIVLRGAAAVIERNNAGKSNWQSWHNAALLAAGLLTGDRSLVDLAIDGTGGFKFQLRESVTPDGPWYEGSWGYHFFALEPLLLTREMAFRAGIGVPESAALKRMLDAPLACVFPDGTLPNFNDGGYTRLAGEARYYDIGYRLFHDARYGAVLAGSKRGIESLLWGFEKPPAADAALLASEMLPFAGVAILRPRGSDHTVAIKFGPHGGGHGHFDKLSFISYANGERQAADPGTQAYGAKSHATWDKMTVAHNTIAVDEKPQTESTGRVLDWMPLPSATAIRVSAGSVYPGVEIERSIVHTGDYTLDIAAARATDSSPHLFDWLYHNFGSVGTILPLEPYSLPRSAGYQHLTGTRAAVTSEAWKATFTQSRSNLSLRVLASPETTVVTGEGLGPDLRVPVPFVMARRKGASARFVALYEPHRTTPTVDTFRDSGDGAFTVAMGQTCDQITIVPGKFSIARSTAGKPVRLILAGISRHEWLESSLNAPLEADWSDGGKTVDLWVRQPSKGTVRIFAPAAQLARLNGTPVASRHDGDFLRILVE